MYIPIEVYFFIFMNNSTNSYITDNSKLVRQIVNIYSEYGSSIQQIAKFLKIKRHQVYYILCKNGIKLRSRGRPRCNILLEDIVSLKNNGVPITKIAKSLNCSIPTIYDKLKGKISAN